MPITRVSDAQTFQFLTTRTGRFQVDILTLQEQIASGKRLVSPDQDPLGAAEVVRANANLAALAEQNRASSFGSDVLGAQDDALAEAGDILVRAQEIATQQASDLLSASERAAAREEVHGLLQGLTAVANGEHAGRRLFGGLALDAPAPFADPDSPGYTAATAYTGSTFEFEVKVGNGSTDRVHISTRGDQVFGTALQALESLETALATNGDVAGTLDALEQGRSVIGAERASVGARQAQLLDRTQAVRGLVEREEQTRAKAQDADLAVVITQLTQAQVALQATLAAAARLADVSLVNLLAI
jgi:flagellar hook-associated protein 3 FlgL